MNNSHKLHGYPKNIRALIHYKVPKMSKPALVRNTHRLHLDYSN